MYSSRETFNTGPPQRSQLNMISTPRVYCQVSLFDRITVRIRTLNVSILGKKAKTSQTPTHILRLQELRSRLRDTSELNHELMAASTQVNGQAVCFSKLCGHLLVNAHIQQCQTCHQTWCRIAQI